MSNRDTLLEGGRVSHLSYCPQFMWTMAEKRMGKPCGENLALVLS